MSSRPEIRDPIKREVRQRCGFGCVICGMPLYEYHHLLGWANVQRHVADEITLLCDTHHHEATHGLLPEKDVLEANADPYNLRTGVSRPHPLHFSGNRFELAIGNNVMTLEDVGSGAAMVPVLIDREPLMVIRIMDEHVLLSLALRDEANNVVCRVIDNELVYSTTPWDISFVGSTLTLRSARSQIRAELKFEPPERLTINRCRLLLNGVEVLVQPEYRPQLGGHPAPHRARGAPWPRHRANRDPHQERVPAYQQGGAQQEPDVGAWPVQEEQEGEKGRGGGFSVSDTPA